MTTSFVTVLRGWPTDPGPPVTNPAGLYFGAWRLGQRVGVVVHTAARLGAVPEAFGLGAALVIMGSSVFSGSLIVPDDLAETSPGVLFAIEEWAKAHPLATTNGTRPWQVVRLLQFFDPLATAEKGEAKPWAFQPNAYSGAGFVVGADLSRTFGLVADLFASGQRRGNLGGLATWLGQETPARLEAALAPPAGSADKRLVGLAAGLGTLRDRAEREACRQAG